MRRPGEAGHMARTQRQGRSADDPSDTRSRDWWEILLRVKTQITGNHVPIVAAGVAFFGLLAVFPAISSLISVAGLVLDPATIKTELNAEIERQIKGDPSDMAAGSQRR